MKVLIISSEVWRYDTNGGNMLSSIFKNTNFEFAQIFCNSGNPANDLCDKYLCITESSSLKSIFRRKSDPFFSVSKSKEKTAVETDPIKNRFKRIKIPLFYLLREFLFSLSKWKKSTKLRDFISSFKPDIIFAPSYASPFMNKLDLFVAKLCNVPVVSYVSDDNYSLKQFSLFPSYWINRFWIRNTTRKFYHTLDLLYTMTQEQKEELGRVFDIDIKILRKDIPFVPKMHSHYNQDNPRAIYAGGLYLNRYRNILLMQKTGQQVFGNNFSIDIYTNCHSKRITNKLEKHGCKIHKTMDYNKLIERYKLYDIAIHTESFSLKHKLLTRLSFSTKIIDCISSGCATFAFLPPNNAGYKFLERENVGICSPSKRHMRNVFYRLKDKSLLLEDVARSSIIYCEKMCSETKYTEIIQKDFLTLKKN